MLRLKHQASHKPRVHIKSQKCEWSLVWCFFKRLKEVTTLVITNQTLYWTSQSQSHCYHEAVTHSIPLTSRRGTRWLVASRGSAARRLAEERSPRRFCVNFCESDSTPWLRFTPPETHTKNNNPSVKTTQVHHLLPGHCARCCLVVQLCAAAQRKMRILRRRGADCTSTSSSGLFRTVRLPEGWFHITADGAWGQCRDDLMKTKPLVANHCLELS